MHRSYEENSVLKNRRLRREKRHNEIFQFIMTIIQAISIAFTIIYNSYISIKTFSFFKILLSLLTLICYGCWLFARLQLGTLLTFRAKADRYLITTGLYSKFRHPIYYFGSLGLFFLFILIEKYYLLFGLLILIPFQIVRALKEQKVLRNKFEEQYEAYERTLWF